MTTLTTADLHLSANPRDAYRIAWCKGLPELLERERAERLIILGDLTSEKDYHGSWLTNRIVDLMRSAAAVCPVYILQGNHDYTKFDNPFFGFLGHYKRIHWINEVTEFDLKGLGRCLFIPHQRKLEAWGDITQLKEEWDWVFTHATFAGVRNEQDMEMEGVPTGLVLGHRVVSGDVHVPQKVGPVTYVGPPYTINFGDKYIPRVLLLTERGANQRLCEGPRKVLLEVTKAANLYNEKVRAGDIVKVRCEVASEDFDKWPEMRRVIHQWAKQNGVQLESALPVPKITDAPQRAERSKPASAASSDEEIVKAYCDRYRVGDKTLKLGLRLMEKSRA